MESRDEDKVVTSDQLPDNPLAMPPPYWRGSGAIFYVVDSLDELIQLLSDLIPLHESTELKLNEHYEKYPDDSESDQALEEFGEICDDLWLLEHKIKMKAELAIFMSAVQSEDELNQFCVYNLHKDIAESIEKLSPAEKLLIASAVVGKDGAKSDAVFESIKKLTSWRNAFAHGHCVDRPTKTLRHNHLIPPPQYPGVPDTIGKMKDLIGAYIKVSKFLDSISLNPYTAGGSAEIGQIEDILKEISRYHFEHSDESNDIYAIVFDEA